MSNLVLYSIPAFIVLMILEGIWTRKHPEHIVGYERRDTVASLSMGVVNVGVSAVAKLASIPFFAWVYTHRIADLGQPSMWWS